MARRGRGDGQVEAVAWAGPCAGVAARLRSNKIAIGGAADMTDPVTVVVEVTEMWGRQGVRGMGRCPRGRV